MLVEASASSPELAIAVANAGSKALVGAVNTINEKQLASADSILDEYGKAARCRTGQDDPRDLVTLQGELAHRHAAQKIIYQRLATAARQGPAQGPGARRRTTRAWSRRADLNEQVITQVSSAHSTGDNRKKTLEIALLGSLVAGLLLGTAIATWLDRRGTTRA